MLQKVRSLSITEELLEIAPLLNRIDKSMPFSIPAGYFEQWTPNLDEEKSQPAKVVKIGSGNWKQWVAAAGIILTLGIGWQFLGNHSSDYTVVTASINDPALDTLLTKVDANSLEGYLENEQSNSDFSSLLVLAEQDIETGVKQLSDDELNWYLENRIVEIPGT